jgi:hypothetical protein
LKGSTEGVFIGGQNAARNICPLIDRFLMTNSSMSVMVTPRLIERNSSIGGPSLGRRDPKALLMLPPRQR